MHSEIVIKRVWRYTWRPWSSEFGGRNRASLEIHLEAVIERVWRCTRRPWSSEFGDALGGRDRVNSRCTWRPRSSDSGDAFGGRDRVTQRCTWRPRSSEFGDAFGDRDRVTQRCTWRPWSSEFGYALAGHDGARSGEYLKAVDRRRAGCWDSIHQLVNSQPWKYDEVTLALSSHGELAGGGRSCREARRKLKLHSGVNSQSSEWWEDRQSWDNAVLAVCSAQCMLYSVLTHDHGMER